MIRAAVPDDLEAIVRLGRVFTEESGLPLTYSSAHARATIWATIHSPKADFLVAIEDDLVVGTVIVIHESDYSAELVSYVDKFFIHKEFRGRGVSRELLVAIEKCCRARGAHLIFASATAGMGERVEKLYVRLFEKHDYSVLGRILMRKLQ